jgi:hypothetical protein
LSSPKEPGPHIKCDQAPGNLNSQHKNLRRNSSKSLFIPQGSSIKFPEAFARPVKHAVEMQASQAQVRANPILFIIGDIEAVKHLDVPFIRHLFEHLPYEIGFLFPQQLLELIGRGMGKMRGIFDFGHTFMARGASEIINDEVPGHAANEAGETLRLSNVPLPNLLKGDAECFLMNVLGDRLVRDFTADDDHHATAISLDQLGFRLPVAGSDMAY